MPIIAMAGPRSGRLLRSIHGAVIISNREGSSGKRMRFKLWLLPAAMLVLAPQPALARARDDVMAGVFRCAAIGDTRLCLDCYYGAAQPARAQLGLPPAPPAQVRLALSPPAG